MSRFLSREAGRLAPYTPGEQPTDAQYIKLNTISSWMGLCSKTPVAA